jgi:hypothetical protein
LFLSGQVARVATCSQFAALYFDRLFFMACNSLVFFHGSYDTGMNRFVTEICQRRSGTLCHIIKMLVFKNIRIRSILDFPLNQPVAPKKGLAGAYETLQRD